MWNNPLFHFLLGAIVSFLFYLWVSKRTGIEGFSFPSASLLVGVICAVLANFLSPWVTPVVLFAYAVATLNEHKVDRTG